MTDDHNSQPTVIKKLAWQVIAGALRQAYGDDGMAAGIHCLIMYRRLMEEFGTGKGDPGSVADSAYEFLVSLDSWVEDGVIVFEGGVLTPAPTIPPEA